MGCERIKDDSKKGPLGEGGKRESGRPWAMHGERKSEGVGSLLETGEVSLTGN